MFVSKVLAIFFMTAFMFVPLLDSEVDMVADQLMLWQLSYQGFVVVVEC